MAKKEFYTERDIEDMARRGEFLLQVHEDVVLTELAYERAERLGVKLVNGIQTPPSAPVRPYLSEPKKTCACAKKEETKPSVDLQQRIRDAVQARLGNQVDPALLDAIIQRVLGNIPTR